MVGHRIRHVRGMGPRFLFNAANIRVGGGVQVAVSVISEWIAIKENLPPGLEIWASTKVDADLRKAGHDPSTLPRYRVLDVMGFRGFLSRALNLLQRFERVFTIFGPMYSLVRPKFSIVGFAQAWIIYPDNEIARRMNPVGRSVLRLKFWIQEQFFRRSDLIVVELEHVARGLTARKIAPSERIEIVPNCLGSIFLQPERWCPIPFSFPSGKIRLGFVGRNYPHKNTSIFPKLARILREIHGIEIEFYVTFTDEEWLECGQEFRDCVRNVGALSVSQCPSFYQEMDGVVYPSLLECFSATPLESLAMGKILFASDRSFNRDVCGVHAIYFDPLDPGDAALKIARYFSSPAGHEPERESAAEHAMSFSNARKRSVDYLNLLCAQGKTDVQ
jgi:glycosyltransferase involved in cell wall biosynthesis